MPAAAQADDEIETNVAHAAKPALDDLDHEPISRQTVNE